MRRSLFAVPALGALLLGACDAQQAAPTASDGTGGTAMPDNATATVAPANLWNGGNARALSLQSAHPNGVVVQVTSLQSQPTSTTVGIRVVNNAGRAVEMNARRGYLLLDNGERLFLSVPATNPDLSIPDQQTFEGELVFVGRLPPVRTATLILNEGSYDSAYTSTPTFRFDLPVGAEAPPAAPAPAPAAPAPSAPASAPATTAPAS